MTNSTVKGKSADYGSLSVEELVSRLCEAEETLDAIRAGEVDAVVVGGPAGQRVYTLENADRPYRVLVEQMQEGAITLAEDGTVLYCNERFATLAGKAHDSIIGQPISMFFSVHENTKICEMIELAIGRGVADELTLISQKGARVPVNMSLDRSEGRCRDTKAHMRHSHGSDFQPDASARTRCCQSKIGRGDCRAA